MQILFTDNHVVHHDYVSLKVIQLIIALLFICLVFYVPIIDFPLNVLCLNTSHNLVEVCSVVFLGAVIPGVCVVLLRSGQVAPNMLHGHPHFQLLESLLCFSPIPFLNPFPCFGRCMREILESYVSENIFTPVFPPRLEGIAQLPLMLLWRGWCRPDPWSFPCDLLILSRSFHSLLFICGVLKFRSNMPLWVGFFFPSYQLRKLPFFSSLKCLQLLLWKLSFPHLLSSLCLDFYCIIWTYHLLGIPPPIFCLLFFALFCFLFGFVYFEKISSTIFSNSSSEFISVIICLVSKSSSLFSECSHPL